MNPAALDRPPKPAKPAKAPKPAKARKPAKRSAASESEADGAPSRQRREQRLEELGVAFRRLVRNFSRLRGRDTHLRDGQLSHAQFELLIELRERGELPAGELAAAARLTPATVTQMLDHLAACGDVERARSESDRRVVVSRLTPQGARKIAAKRAAWKGRWENALEGLPLDELRAATRVLERLAAMVEDAESGDDPGASTPPVESA